MSQNNILTFSQWAHHTLTAEELVQFKTDAPKQPEERSVEFNILQTRYFDYRSKFDDITENVAK